MSIEIEVDGSFFTFPDGWILSKIDDWPEQKKLTSPPYHSSGCDLIAVNSSELWFIEAKDYSYPGASIPSDLAEKVGKKVFHSLAVLHATARWGVGDNQKLSVSALSCTTAKICLAIELPDGGRKLMGVERPLSDLVAVLKPVLKKLGGVRPVVSNSHIPNGVPWTVRRDPNTRGTHQDR